MSWPQQYDEYPSSLISDGLDALGVPPRVVSPRVKLLAPASIVRRFAGPAKTMRWHLRSPAEPLAAAPLNKTIQVIERMEQYVQAGDVVVMGFDAPPREMGVLGELFARLYSNKQVAGVLTDGFVRDLQKIVDLGLPVAAAGPCPLNARGRWSLLGLDEQVEVGGIEIFAGDGIVTDHDGTVVIPREQLESGRLLDWLQQAVQSERQTVAHLANGGTLSEAFAKFGAV